MPFGLTYEAIEDLIRKTALDVRMARAIARRAGIRPDILSRPVTVLDNYVSADQGALRMQWTADLTGFTRVRFASNSASSVYVLYSTTASGAYDPGDYTLLTGEDDTGASVEVSGSAGDTPQWLTLPTEARQVVRFVLSTSSSGVSSTLDSSAFMAVLEVA